MLALTFSEVVSTVAFNAKGITLQSDFDSTEGYTLQSSSTTSPTA